MLIVLELFIIRDNYSFVSFVIIGVNGFNCFYDIEFFDDYFEYNMFFIELWCGDGGDEELGFIVVGFSICY